VRFAYEWHDSSQWFRSYGNENWEFDSDGLMQRRFASINVLPIKMLIAGSIGHLAADPTIIRVFPLLVFD
jgi:nuclear transport factor 2 (NTF2) superfamily protein